MMKSYLVAMDKVNSVLKMLLVAFISIAFLALLLQVFSRFVLQVPVSWTEELSRFLMVWITFIGASLAVRYHQLIRIEAILNVVPRTAQILIQAASSIILLVFCAVVFYYGLHVLKIVHMQSSPALHIPMSIPYSAILVGCLLMFLNTVAGFIEMIQSKQGE